MEHSPDSWHFCDVFSWYCLEEPLGTFKMKTFPYVFSSIKADTELEVTLAVKLLVFGAFILAFFFFSVRKVKSFSVIPFKISCISHRYS